MKMYRKKQLQQMFPWEPSVDMSRVSVSQADKDNGSPKIGDMIAVNPSDTGDMWLVAEKFFKDNYEEATQNRYFVALTYWVGGTNTSKFLYTIVDDFNIEVDGLNNYAKSLVQNMDKSYDVDNLVVRVDAFNPV